MTQHYIGRKILVAWSQDMVQAQGELPRPGYGVKYADGYTSWSPKDTFEAAYIRLGVLDNLPDWHQRLIGEHALLDADVRALDKFTDTSAFDAIDADHQTLLRLQLETMFRYRDILEQRLEMLGTPRARLTLNVPAADTGD